MKRSALIATVLVFASLAFAAGLTIDPAGRWVKGSLWIGTKGTGLAQNAITQTLAVTAARDLGAVDGGCYYGSIPLVGAQAGDACMASQTSPYLAGINPECFVSAADYVTIYSCQSWDPPDAGFSVRVFSAQ